MPKPTPAQRRYYRRGTSPDAKVPVTIRLHPATLARVKAQGGLAKVVEVGLGRGK